MVDKIIFLDIDGPMIPGTMYMEDVFCSLHQEFDPRSVMVLKKILEKSDAKIVLNTSHNNQLHPGKNYPGLLSAFKKQGLDIYLHEDCKTTYPSPIKDWLVPSGREVTRRLVAIYEWLHDHYDIDGFILNGRPEDEVLWIALDDEPIDDECAYTVDFDRGLSIKEYNHASKYLNFKDLLNTV